MKYPSKGLIVLLLTLSINAKKCLKIGAKNTTPQYESLTKKDKTVGEKMSTETPEGFTTTEPKTIEVVPTQYFETVSEAGISTKDEGSNDTEKHNSTPISFQTTLIATKQKLLTTTTDITNRTSSTKTSGILNAVEISRYRRALNNKNCDFDIKFVELLLRNEFAEEGKVSKANMLKSMCILPKIVTSLKDRNKIWKVIKDGRSASMLTIDDLEAGRCLLPSIPETDLRNLNFQDWDIIGFLGKVKEFQRKHMGILAYGVTRTWGADILKPQHINKMYGILCGFTPEQLKQITSTEYGLISDEVFMHISGCTENQLTVLYLINMNSKVHGPIQSWTAEDVKEMGMVLKGMELHDFPSITPKAMAGIDYRTIKELSPEQLMAFSTEQLKNLQTDAKAEFFKRVPIFSSTNIINLRTSLLIIFLTIQILV